MKTSLTEKQYLANFSQKLNAVIKDGAKGPLLKALAGQDFWKKFVYQVNDAHAISEESIRIISNHKNNKEQLELFIELSKIDSGFGDFIKNKIKSIQIDIAGNLKAQGAFDEKTIQKALNNILSVLNPEPANTKGSDFTIIKYKTNKAPAKKNLNQRILKKLRS